MAAIKTSTLNLRIDPGVKEAVRMAAEHEHRSIANFVEFLIRKYCQQAGINIPQQHALFEKENEH